MRLTRNRLFPVILRFESEVDSLYPNPVSAAWNAPPIGVDSIFLLFCSVFVILEIIDDTLCSFPDKVFFFTSNSPHKLILSL